MKIIFEIQFILIMFACLLMTGCKKDDDVPKGEWRVKSITLQGHEPNWSEAVYRFSYDDSGRIKQFSDSYTGNIYNYEYQKNSVTISVYYGIFHSNDLFTYALNSKGYIEEGPYRYTYNQDGYIATANDYDFMTYYFERDSKMFSMSYILENINWDDGFFIGTYTDEENNSNIDINPFILYNNFEWCDRYLAAFGFLGKKQQYIIDTERYWGEDSDDFFDTLTIERNENNLISKITRAFRMNAGTEIFTIEYEYVER